MGTDSSGCRLRNCNGVLPAAREGRVETPAEPLMLEDFRDFLVDVPTPTTVAIAERNLEWIRRTPIKRDYLEREARNPVARCCRAFADHFLA